MLIPSLLACLNLWLHDHDQCFPVVVVSTAVDHARTQRPLQHGAIIYTVPRPCRHAANIRPMTPTQVFWTRHMEDCWLAHLSHPSEPFFFRGKSCLVAQGL